MLSFSPCFNYVNPTHYRETCDQAVNAGAKKGPCLLATAYFASCRFARVFVNVPDACGTFLHLIIKYFNNRF